MFVTFNFYFVINVIQNVRNEIFINKMFEFMRILCDFLKNKFVFFSLAFDDLLHIANHGMKVALARLNKLIISR